MDTLKRFCNDCGKISTVRPMTFIEKTKDGFVYQAVCSKGHDFSPTLFGESVVILRLSCEDCYNPRLDKHGKNCPCKCCDGL